MEKGEEKDHFLPGDENSKIGVGDRGVFFNLLGRGRWRDRKVTELTGIEQW